MGCMPLPTNSVLGSFSGTTLADGIAMDPCRVISSKKLFRISSGVIGHTVRWFTFRAAGHSCQLAVIWANGSRERSVTRPKCLAANTKVMSQALSGQPGPVLDRIWDETMRAGRPDLADAFVGPVTVAGFCPGCEILCVHSVSEMFAQMIMTALMVSLHRRLSDHAVHSLGLDFGRMLVWLGWPMGYLIGCAGDIKPHSPATRGVAVAWVVRRTGAVIHCPVGKLLRCCLNKGQNLVDAITHAPEQMFRELLRVLRSAFSTNWEMQTRHSDQCLQRNRAGRGSPNPGDVTCHTGRVCLQGGGGCCLPSRQTGHTPFTIYIVPRSYWPMARR